MFSLSQMTPASEDYLLAMVYYCVNRKRRKKKRRRGSDDGDDSPGTAPDPDGFEFGEAQPYSIEMPGEPPGKWFGTGAARLGLSGMVEEIPYRRVFKGFHPFTEVALVQNAGKPNRRAGWEGCFSVRKDVSVLWSQASPEDRERIERIVWDAAEATLRMMEHRFAVSRVGKASEGCGYVSAGLVLPMFQHASSRAQDPDLHIHVQILNLGVDETGHTRSTDPTPIFENQLLFGAFFQAKVAAGLRTELGLILEPDGTGYGIRGSSP